MRQHSGALVPKWNRQITRCIPPPPPPPPTCEKPSVNETSPVGGGGGGGGGGVGMEARSYSVSGPCIEWGMVTFFDLPPQ